jgi:hypothetical protein
MVGFTYTHTERVRARTFLLLPTGEMMDKDDECDASFWN